MPLRASYACKSSNLLHPPFGIRTTASPSFATLYHHEGTRSYATVGQTSHGEGAPPSCAVRGTSKVQRFRPKSARPSPSNRDGRTFALSCRHFLSRSAWLHRALPPTCRYVLHAIPKSLPP